MEKGRAKMTGYWPTAEKWERSDDGWDLSALEAALAAARDANSTDVAIVHRGRLVVDAVWEPSAAASGAVVEKLSAGRVRQDVASAQKSITSVLAGIAVGRGLLDVAAPVTSYLGAGWAGPAAPVSEPNITVHHLLSMTSGLADNMSFVAPPGVRWDYNLGAGYHTMKRVVSAAAGLPLTELTAKWLTEPLHMRDTNWVSRALWEGMPEFLRSSSLYPDGEPIEGLVTTALDLARFGLAVSRGCRSADGPLGVSPDYATAMLRPSQPLNPAYGYLWWLNGQDGYLEAKNETLFEGAFFPGVPDDAFAALGAMDRLCAIVPSLDLVITRCGALAGEQSMAASRFVRSFVPSVCAALSTTSTARVSSPD